MKRIFCFLIIGLTFSSGQETELTEEDKRSFLRKLDELQEKVEGRAEERAGSAYQSFKKAVASDKAAYELFLNCTEQVEFKQQKRDGQAFREWQREHEDGRGIKAFQRAIRLQLNWLLVGIESGRTGANSEAVTGLAVQAIDQILSDAKILQETVEIGGRGRDRMSAFSILEEDVYDSVFAQFFDVKPPTAEWPKAPLDLEDVYEHVILKSYKEEQDVARYRQAFGKRILQEGLLAEMKGRKPDVGGREEKTAAFEIFLKEERPQLLWELERQVYELGDQQGAALGMLQHLGKFAGHVNETEWTNDLRILLQEKSEEDS